MSDPGQRQADAKRRAELHRAGRRAESQEAGRLIEGFIAEAGRRGLAPVPPVATTYAGAQVKTNVTGWYLNRARSVAVGADGGYYRLIVPGALLARFTGVTLRPEDPPLRVGEGGRDGEGGDLAWFLQRVLDGEASEGS